MNAPIILITNSCPFQGEVFLKNELDHIPADREVLLFPILPGKTGPLPNWGKPHIRVITGGAFPTAVEKLAALPHGLTAPFRNGELKEILRKPAPGRNFLKAVKFAFLSDSRARAIRRCLKAEKLESSPVFYSYWFYESAYAAARLRRLYPGSRFVSRCHGYDLYEVRHPGGYLPFRPYLTKQADVLCPISQDGMDYVKERFPDCTLQLARLGTGDHGLCDAEKDSTVTIVSCSNLVDVKRVDLLIRGLSLCQTPIRWFHFGDGPLMETLRRQAEALPRHIDWQFMGNVPNHELMDFYKHNYVDAFINVSSSEGIPVSIMDALSFGIPAIATDVGGTHEIVINGHNGLLLPADPEPDTIAEAISRLTEMVNARSNARALWQDRCDAAANYSLFYQNILSEQKNSN